MPVISDTIASDLTFSEIIIGIVIALILVTLWQRAIENWLYESLGLDKKSTFQTLIVAVAFTIIFFYFISIISSFSQDIILGTSNTTTNSTATEQLFNSQEVVEVNVEPRCCGDDSNCECKSIKNKNQCKHDRAKCNRGRCGGSDESQSIRRSREETKTYTISRIKHQ